MARLRSFTLEGDALLVSARLNNSREPVYRVELLNEFDGRDLSSDDLRRISRALLNDICVWGGLLYRCSDDTFTNEQIVEFEKAWGGASDGIPLHPAPEE